MTMEGKGQKTIASALGISKFQVRQLKQHLEETSQLENAMNKETKAQEAAKNESKNRKKTTVEVIIPTPDKHINKKEVSIIPGYKMQFLKLD